VWFEPINYDGGKDRTEKKMAKKIVLALVLATFVAGGAFSQMSIGAGGFIGGDFGGGAEASVSGTKVKAETPYFGGGAFAFLDFVFAELSIGISGGGGDMKVSSGGSTKWDWSITNFNIGLLGKYPVAMNNRLLLFPLFGIDYLIALSVKDDDDYIENVFDIDAGDFSALWFKFGGGVDYSLTNKIYLRFEALYGIRLANKAEKDMVDDAKDSGASDVKALLGHGLTVKMAVGYKF
jgi:hypothetical protein